MARYDFCHTVHDEKIGIDTIFDVECEVEIEFVLLGGSPDYSIGGVFLNDHNLFDGSGLSRALAATIANAAEDNLNAGGYLLDAVMEREGVVYRGLGGNDPDGRLVRVA